MRALTAAIVAAVVVLTLHGVSAAQDITDRQFMMQAAQGGMAEVELGQLATQRAATEAVRAFGQRMMVDHARANNELRRIAESEAVPLPTSIDARHQATKDRLSTLSGSAFDRAYMRDMVTHHENDIAQFEQETRQGRDAAGQAWAQQTLPTLREHLRLARTVDSQVAQLAPGVVAASPGAATVIVWCDGAYVPTQGTNFGSCPR